MDLPPESADITDFSLSDGQQAIWFTHELDPESSAYNTHVAARIRSTLHAPSLRRAAEALAARHEMLRVRFSSEGGVPVQRVAPQMPVDFAHCELPLASEAELRARAEAEVRRPFDLARGPAWRIALFSAGSDEHALVITAHHLLIDLVAFSVLLDELSRLYSEFARGAAPVLPRPERSYRDYIASQEQLLASAEGAAMQRYWREELSGKALVLDLPAGRRQALATSRAPAQRHEGDSWAFALPPGTRARVRALAAACGATPFMVLLAAYQALLGRHAGQEEFFVGAPVPGRPRDKRLDGVIGHFVNMLPLRANLSGAPTFAELVARTRRTVSNGRAHQEYPFSRMVQDLGRARDGSSSPVFQALFSVQRAPIEALSPLFVRASRPVSIQLGELALEPLGITQQEGLLDLALELVEVDGEYHAELKYRTALFDAATIQAMAASFCALLGAALERPERPVAELPLLAPEQRARALAAGEGGPALPAEPTFIALFDAQAERTPDAVAVRAGDATLGYAELRRATEHLARRLRDRGIGRGQVVGLAMERGIPLLVAVLGVLRAGGAYVALDPAHPTAYGAQILAQAGAAGILATRDTMPAADALCAALDRRPFAAAVEDLAGEPAAPGALPAPAPEDLAYVVFTSGSTGAPKGAMVEHRGMLGHLRAKIEALGLRAGDVIAQTAPQSFVIANWQLLAGLLVGAEVHVIERAAALDPRALLARVDAGGVTILELVPSLLRAALEHLEARGARRTPLARLRWLVPTGEALPADLCRRWLALFPSIPLLNAYGCSECSDDVAHQPVVAPPPAGQAQVPIGRPVRGARLYVLDGHREPVPDGVPGDLWVGGDAVGRGYLGDRGQTEAAFAPDPFAAAPGARMYRTGDRALRRHDGTFEYLGRADHQVKVRGVRVELGEIEAALREHPEVRDAAVTAGAAAPGDVRLVAHVAPEPGSAPAPATLRRFLERRLPAPMIPAAFALREALPRNQHGKLDRRALEQLSRAAAPDLPAAPAPAAERAEAESPLETELLAMWAELLGAPAVGREDDFFALGGHSLLAVRLMVRLRERYGVELPLAAIFEVSTVAGLARTIEARQAEGAGSAAAGAAASLALSPERLHEPFPLTELQQAYWIGQSALVEGRTPSVAYLEHEVEDLDVARFERAMQRLIERHPMLRAVIRSDGRQEVLERVPPFTLALTDLRGASEEEAAARIAAARDELSSTGPEPDRWPMLRLAAHRLDERRTLLSIGFPLLLGDLQSFRVLSRDLELLYGDRAAELPPLRPTFRDYVEHLGASRGSPGHARAEAYWRARLGALPAAPELPVARAAAEREGDAAFRRWQGTLAPASWRELKRRAQRSGLTPTSVVAAAYAEVLGAFSRSPHFTLNLLYQHRPPLHPDIQDIVGNFSTTILLEVDGRPAEGFEARARRLQAQLWQDLDHAQVSGVQVVRELGQARGGPGAAMPVVLASTLHLDAEAFEASPLLGRPLSSRLRTAHVWIDHQVSETREGLRFHWDAREAIFPPGLVDAMFAAYTDLLGRLARGEGWDAVSAVRLPASELRARQEANATEAPLSAAPLHELFAAQARQRPDQPAVIAADRALTYGELSRRVSPLAWRLRALGARPGRLVGIVMRKGWEQVVAALAIVTAGAAYLPIDPELPEERLRALIELGQVDVLLTQSAVEANVAWPEGLTRIAVDASPESADAPPEIALRPEDLAYVIFTSGSTGQPKGVMIDHRGAVNTILDINRRLRVGPSDRTLSLSSLSFDLSVYDIFGLLAAGGAIVMPDPDRARDPGHWARVGRELGVTIWSSVPQLAQLLVEHEEQTGGPGLPRLRAVMMSGDWIPVSLPARLLSVAPAARALSLGGATEASIWSIVHPIDAVDPSWQSIPYGKPLANQRFHVLNDRLDPCPVHVAGELYIGGAGLARGYWRDPERTAERFIRHPATGERLYRTGDLGRYLPDGSIEFLGRADLQVKVQGFRVELGEIEVALGQHPRVKACAVIAEGPAQGDKRLAAYVVAEGGAEIAAEELRLHLARKLPAYMVPAVYAPLSALPLSANGKVDRRALPAAAQAAQRGRPRERVAPRSELEATLARLWREITERDEVGVHDDFFADLGGNSFAAVRLLARTTAVLGHAWPLSSLLAEPTIAAQAAAIAGQRGAAPFSPRVLLRPGGPGVPLFLVHPIGGGVLCYRELAAQLAPARPIYGLAGRGFAEAQDPFSSVTDMAAAYAGAILEEQPAGPYLLGGWSMGALVALEVSRVLEAMGHEVALIAAIDGATPGRVARQNDLSLLAWFLRDLVASSGAGRPALPMERVAAMASEARLEALLAWAREAGHLAADTELAQVARLQRIFLAHHAAMQGYTPGATRAPVLLLDAAEQPDPERARRWARWTPRLERLELPGDHHTILSAANQGSLVSALAPRLAAVSGGRRSTAGRAA
ncbi:amino acid adenylation domain-containing protein [Sorangium sp. So ce1078]|uniref:amino acid adenylation domain-containing protein n=1 Tax=Sorangium sp. So ce1078 TaxID=3133329 RepID=UPI003F5EF07F